MQILVFKTNLEDKQHISVARKLLSKMQGILYWNVDLHDIDKILRIEANELLLVPVRVEQTLQQAGYYCEELKD
ncbi:MAG: hypothetical protein V4722_14355 [Bacteroidota bacterium]